jgi:hypothetical protein
MEESVFTGSRKATVRSWARSSHVPEKFARELYQAIDEPGDSPYLMTSLMAKHRRLTKKGKKEVRMALIRVQMGCSLNSHSDHVKASKQLFVTQVLEKMFFGSNFISEEDKHFDEDDD